MQHRQQQVQSLLASNRAANSTGVSRRGGPAPAIFSTSRLFTHLSFTPSRSSQARLASFSGSVESLSNPAVFISLAAARMSLRHLATAGMYLSLEIAWALIFTEAAMYFFLTPILAASWGFAPTHFAPLRSARVSLAAILGYFRASLPLTTATQQNSSQYGSSTAWSAIAGTRTSPLPIRMVPMGSVVATASTSPLSTASPRTSGLMAFHVTSCASGRGSIPWAASTREANR